MIVSKVNPKFLIKYNMTERECEKYEHVLLTRLALLDEFWKVTDGYMDEEELAYVQHTQLEIEYNLMMMYVPDGITIYDRNKKKILSNIPPLYL